MSEYSEKFKDPRWQKIRLEVFERDGWYCQKCNETEKTLHVHHKYYKKSKEPWEYPIEDLVTLCEDCHEEEGRIRPGIERSLLFALRKLFFADELSEIAIGFHCINPCADHGGCQPSIMSGAIAFALTDIQMQKIMLENYWKELRIRSLKRDIDELKEKIKEMKQSEE